MLKPSTDANSHACKFIGKIDEDIWQRNFRTASWKACLGACVADDCRWCCIGAANSATERAAPCCI